MFAEGARRLTGVSANNRWANQSDPELRALDSRGSQKYLKVAGLENMLEHLGKYVVVGDTTKELVSRV